MNKLLEIQTELKAPKGQYNSFGGYNYRSAEDILEAVKPILKEKDCTLTLSDEMIEVGGRIYVKATARFNDGTNETVVTASAREAEVKKGMDDSQITGTASSYARKYALNGLFLIDDTKDADTDEYQKQTSKKTVSDAKPSAKIDFTDLWGKYKAMSKVDLRKEYAQVIKNTEYTSNQKKAICEIITKCQEGKE